MSSLTTVGAGPSSAGGFSPLDIADLQLWLDASKITGIADGADLATWSDLSGNSRHATQSTAANKPHYQEAYQNGLGAVEFDGVHHWMSLDFSSAVSADDHTVIIAMETQNTGTKADQRLIDFEVGRLLISCVTATAGKVGYWETNWVNAANATDGAQVLTWQLDNAGTELFRDGISIADSLALTNRALGGSVGMGREYSGVDYELDGLLFEVLIYSPMLNATDRALVENYLIAKWGI